MIITASLMQYYNLDIPAPIHLYLLSFQSNHEIVPWSKGFDAELDL